MVAKRPDLTGNGQTLPAHNRHKDKNNYNNMQMKRKQEKQKRVPYNMNMNIKEGDKLTITACYFQVPDYRDNQPCVIIYPILRYVESSCANYAVEDLLEDIIVYENIKSNMYEEVDKHLKWVGKSAKSTIAKIRQSLKTKQKPFRKMFNEVVSVEVEIYRDKNGLQYKETNRIEI
jgi:hypothetical protein